MSRHKVLRFLALSVGIVATACRSDAPTTPTSGMPSASEPSGLPAVVPTVTGPLGIPATSSRASLPPTSDPLGLPPAGPELPGPDRALAQTISMAAEASSGNDLMWRNTSTGANAVWEMDGTDLVSGQTLLTVADQDWVVGGLADFNGDGKTDILWRNGTTGANTVWLMDENTILSGLSLASVADANWRIGGVGDFDGDGTQDIVWRNTSTGANALWIMDNGVVERGETLLTVADLDWKLRGVGDANANGKPDMVWRNTATGANALWDMDGITILSGANITTVTDMNWDIAAFGDMTGDGKSDLVWRNSATGANAIWQMDAHSLVAGLTTLTVADAAWKIVGVGDLFGVVEPLAISTTSLHDGRQSVAYNATLAASGGSGTRTWSVASGSLPAGITLSASGTLSGTPTVTGAFAFTGRVTDSRGTTADVALDLFVCDAPVTLAVGGVAEASFPTRCGIMIPPSSGTFRVGLMARRIDLGAASVSGGIRLRALAGTPGPSVPSPELPLLPLRTHSTVAPGIDPSILRLAETTEAVHLRLREEEARQFTGTPVGGPPTPLGPTLEQLGLQPSEPAAPAATRSFYVIDPSTSVRSLLSATLRASDDNIYYYEDDGVTAAGTRATDAEIAAVMAYYASYGKPVIDAFGGLGPSGTTQNFKDDSGNVLTLPTNDIDQNGGRFIILQLRPSKMLSGAAAYVSSCDRYPRLEHLNAGFYCPGSNEMEITYFLRPDSDYYRGVGVHEAKHISSHGYAVFGGRSFNPSWIEEGTAEIANEMASRDAAGFADGAEVGLSDIYPGGSLTANTYALAVMHSRARTFLKASPLSALIGDPSPNPSGSTIYGASWLFHRYLVDAYSGGNENAMVLALNTVSSGPSRISTVTGQSMATLLSEFLTAIAVEGASAAEAAQSKKMVSYDHAGIASGFAETWPYVESSTGFTSGTFDLSTHYTSPNFFDFAGPSAAHLRLDAFDTSGSPLSATPDVVLRVVRIN